jgi:hypothetical protein
MARLVRAGRTALVVMLSVLAASACADDHVLSPASAPIPPRAGLSAVEAAYELVPGAPVHTEWTEYTTIPDSSWILVEISGTISYSRNPYCYTPGAKGHCDGPPTPIETGGPWGPLQEGALAGYTIQYGSQPAPNSPGHGERLYSPTGNPASETGRRLFYNGVGPGRLWARRVVHQTYAGSTTSGVYWPVFIHSGGQVVKVTVVPTPLRVDGPSTVPPGEPGTWTASIVGDFRHRADNGAVPAVQWEFFPGDTFATHNRFAPRETVRESVCRALECTYTPYKSGRMVASTYVEGQYVNVASQVFRQDVAGLELSCNRYNLQRGQSLACTAQAKPSGTLDSIRWQFVDTAGHVIRDSTGSASWGGTMVAGGRISVTARLNGTSATKDTAVVVRPRQWPRPAVRPHEEPATDLPAPNSVQQPHDLGDAHVDSTANPPLTTRKIDSGPNAGWWFIPDHIREIPVTVHINYAAFQAGSAWYNLQTGGAWTDPTTGITHPNGYCTQAQVPTLRRLTREHEGSLSSSLTSHVDAMRVYISNNAPQDSMEAVIAWDADVQTFSFDRAVRSWYRAYIRGGLVGFSAPHKPTGIVDPAPFPCAARPWR